MLKPSKIKNYALILLIVTGVADSVNGSDLGILRTAAIKATSTDTQSQADFDFYWSGENPDSIIVLHNNF